MKLEDTCTLFAVFCQDVGEEATTKPIPHAPSTWWEQLLRRPKRHIPFEEYVVRIAQAKHNLHHYRLPNDLPTRMPYRQRLDAPATTESITRLLVTGRLYHALQMELMMHNTQAPYIIQQLQDAHQPLTTGILIGMIFPQASLPAEVPWNRFYEGVKSGQAWMAKAKY